MSNVKPAIRRARGSAPVTWLASASEARRTNNSPRSLPNADPESAARPMNCATDLTLALPASRARRHARRVPFVETDTGAGHVHDEIGLVEPGELEPQKERQDDPQRARRRWDDGEGGTCELRFRARS